MNFSFIDHRFGNATQVRVSFSRYSVNDHPSIQLVDEDGMPYGVASSNFPEYFLSPDVVAIKNHAENEGIADLLVQCGVLEKEVQGVIEGDFVSYPLYRLTAAAIQALPPVPEKVDLNPGSPFRPY